jgi:hypothetical protein
MVIFHGYVSLPEGKRIYQHVNGGSEASNPEGFPLEFSDSQAYGGDKMWLWETR